MSKTPINFNTIDSDALIYLNNFVVARVAIAKEDMRHKEVIKPLKEKLKVIQENRDNDLSQNIPLNDVIRKHSTIEVENEIRKENDVHKRILKPLNIDLKSTYIFIPDGLYDSYVRKIELGKRGTFIECIKVFLDNIGIEEVSQSALGKLSEQMSDCFGINVTNSKTLLEKGVLSSSLSILQFNKLFMSVFCDILVRNRVIQINIQ